MKTAKFHRKRDQRQALVKSLAESLVLYESIETTLPKAKAVARYTEKLITKAKKGQKSLHDRRQVIGSLPSLEAAHKLVDEIAPKLSGRNSGYFRIEKTDLRQGDSAQMAKVSFVDDLKSTKTLDGAPKKSTESKTQAKEKDQETTPDTTRTSVKNPVNKVSQPQLQVKTPKRTGIRGNK